MELTALYKRKEKTSNYIALEFSEDGGVDQLLEGMIPNTYPTREKPEN